MQPTPLITVVGSANVDLIMQMERLPRVGETVTDAVFSQTFGGKGANQAAAAARAGGRVSFVCCVGADAYGTQVAENLRAQGCDVEFVFSDPQVATGTALIMIGPRGENLLSVAPGANYRLLPEHVERARGEIEQSALVMLQSEISLATLQHSVNVAHALGVPVMFNAAPARPLGALPLDKITYLVVNETEAAAMSGLPVDNGAQAWQVAEALLALGPQVVILTLGAQGCLALKNGLRTQAPAFVVKAVDTTAAGDVFCGALATALVEGQELLTGLRFASAAAAICVTRLGAQPSIPNRAEIDAFLEDHP